MCIDAQCSRLISAKSARYTAGMASGKSSANLYALGPLRKATLWETTGVPEIREQAWELAERIVSQLSENGVRKLNGVARSMAAGKI